MGAALKVETFKSGFNLTSPDRGAIYLDYGIYLMRKGRWDVCIYIYMIYVYMIYICTYRGINKDIQGII